MSFLCSRAAGQAWRRLAPVLLWLAAALLPALGVHAQPPPSLLLDPDQPDVAVTSALGAFGPVPRGGIVAVSGGSVPLRLLDLRQPLRFREGEALWLKLRLQPAAGSTENWQLEVPVPVMDRVTLYQQDATGRWFASSAGDLVPVREWPQPGRYPYFRLQLREGGTTDVFLEVRHSATLTLPLRLVTSGAHFERMLVEYLVLGLFMGVLTLLVLASLVRALLLRDGAYLWFAVFALVAMLALAAFTGVAAHLLWGNAGSWVDSAPAVLAMLGGSLALVVVRQLSGVAARLPWLRRSLYLLSLAGVLFAGLFPLLERSVGLVLLGAHLLGVAFLSLVAATRTWRRGDPVGLWMLLGAVPLALTVGMALARVFGWVASSWIAEYALVLALTVNLPMLFGALNSRSQERRSVELRRLAAASQDALTGLLKRRPFVARLHQALARYERRGEPAAVAVIELINHAWIQKTRGAEAAEEALLRTVIKLRRLVRDVDTTGRIGENRFGLILEGVALRWPMNNVATRLVAAGLMEEPDAPRDIVLHFHVAAVVLTEHRAPAEELLQALGTVLDTMSPRARRPLRFLEPGGHASAQDPPGGATDGPADGPTPVVA